MCVLLLLLCPHIVAAIKNLKCPACSSRGLGLGRTWHRTSWQRSPKTRHARIRERRGGADRGNRQGEQTKGAGALRHIKHNHTQAHIRRHEHTPTHTQKHTETRQGCFIHSFFIFTAPLFAGMAVSTSPMSMSVAIGRTRTATCTKHTDSKQGMAQHEDEQHGRRKPLLRPGEQSEPKSKSEDARSDLHQGNSE